MPGRSCTQADPEPAHLHSIGNDDPGAALKTPLLIKVPV